MIDCDFSWQSGFYDSIICTAGQLARVRKYIENNPLNWMQGRRVQGRCMQDRWMQAPSGLPAYVNFSGVDFSP